MTLKLIGLGGTIPVRDETLRAITIKSMPVTMGWIVMIVLLAIYGGLLFWRQSRLAAKDLHRPPNSLLLFKFVALCVVLLGMTLVLSQNRSRVATFVIEGIPYAVILVGALLIFWSVVFGRTPYGRHIYAIGGNTVQEVGEGQLGGPDDHRVAAQRGQHVLESLQDWALTAPAEQEQIDPVDVLVRADGATAAILDN